MGIDNDGRGVKDMAQYDVGCLAADAGKPRQLCHGRGDLAAEFLHELLRAALEGFCLSTK